MLENGRRANVTCPPPKTLGRHLQGFQRMSPGVQKVAVRPHVAQKSDLMVIRQRSTTTNSGSLPPLWPGTGRRSPHSVRWDRRRPATLATGRYASRLTDEATAPSMIGLLGTAESSSSSALVIRSRRHPRKLCDATLKSRSRWKLGSWCDASGYCSSVPERRA